MSGMKAGLFYPTWPYMNGEFIPSILTSSENWQAEHLKDYDKYGFAPALVQVLHRNLAYIITLLAIWFSYKNYAIASPLGKKNMVIILFILFIQVILGILTVLACKSGIPLTLGVLHQLVAILLLMSISFLVFNLRANSLS
jgi:cytochrome c oxidase assembly protein subunit 15